MPTRPPPPPSPSPRRRTTSTTSGPTSAIHPSGAVYVVFNDNNHATGKRSIQLYKYEGGRVSFVKNVSESNLMAYEPDLTIGSDGWIHLAWAEAADANADTQHIKYRYFNGSSWSAVIDPEDPDHHRHR